MAEEFAQLQIVSVYELAFPQKEASMLPATNAMHPNKYRTIPAVIYKPAQKSKLTESAKRQKIS